MTRMWFQHSSTALLLGGLVCLVAVRPVAASEPGAASPRAVPAQKQQAQKQQANRSGSAAKNNAATPKDQQPADVKEVNLLEGLRSGQVAVQAEGTGDGRMTLSVTNRTNLRRGLAHVMGSVVRPVFFLNPCGWGSETDRVTSNFEVSRKVTARRE
jgi:hypothetical protein